MIINHAKNEMKIGNRPLSKKLKKNYQDLIIYQTIAVNF